MLKAYVYNLKIEEAHILRSWFEMVCTFIIEILAPRNEIMESSKCAWIEAL